MTLLAAATFAVTRIGSARADGASACPCVMIIQVDGLEPKDVTRETTPFLWALGHAVSTTNPYDLAPGVSGRQGFTWVAPRGPMSAGVAPATAALLTGGYPEQSGVPADHYIDDKHVERSVFAPDWTTTSNPDGTPPSGDPAQLSDPLQADSLVDLVPDQTDFKSEVYLGDPALKPFFPLVDGKLPPGSWSPDTSNQGDPALCPVPQDENATPQIQQTICPADDIATLNAAHDGLTDATNGAKVKLAFIHLAEVGAIKRQQGDVDTFSSGSNSGSQTPQQSQSVADALNKMDQAIGSFVARYSQDGAGKDNWGQTVLIVTGDHGYEATPQAARVPDPLAATDPTKDLSDFVRSQSGDKAELISQGTFGTVYWKGDPAQRDAGLADLRKHLLADPNATQACQQATPVNPGGGCIQQVLYVHPNATDPDQPSAPTTLATAHPGWHLDPIDKDGNSTGAAGDMVVVTNPGWATGRATTAPDPTSTDPTPPLDNPYLGNGGGPRDRAVAMLVNGPTTAVRGWPDSQDNGFFPITSGAQDDTKCKDLGTNPNASTTETDVTSANLNPADDATAVGHECQPETVDIAPTVAAYLQISMNDKQLAGRFLQEAFQHDLQPLTQKEDLGQQDVQPEPPPPAQDIYIPPPPPPPPPPKGFDFYGLVRGLKAQVVDANGCTYDQAHRGSAFNFLRIEGDFGKPTEALTLTFYKRDSAKAAKKKKKNVKKAAFTRFRAGQFHWLAAASTTKKKAAPTKCIGAPDAQAGAAAAKRAKSSPQLPLKTVARFAPFTVERGHVVLRLQVPDQFKPDHVGILVQQAKKLAGAIPAKNGKPGPKFQGVGQKTGAIIPIQSAARLHTVRGGKPRR